MRLAATRCADTACGHCGVGVGDVLAGIHAPEISLGAGRAGWIGGGARRRVRVCGHLLYVDGMRDFAAGLAQGEPVAKVVGNCLLYTSDAADE